MESAVAPQPQAPLFVSFLAGPTGAWKIDRIDAVIGETLPPGPCLQVVEATVLQPSMPGVWQLRGVTSNTRYSTQSEVETLKNRQEALGRPHATQAALIPIRKSAAWWALAQDQRRTLFKEQSRHIAIDLDYLPQIARRLHHSRDLREPFDFLTWFEFAPEHTDAFEELVQRLRTTPEWAFVEREVDIRFTRS